jgi:Tol biopolymer transport system component
VPGDTNGRLDIFVRDRRAGTTRRASVSSGGIQADDACWNPALSADGRFVAFSTIATSLVPGDTNGVSDIFLRDRKTGTTRRVSLGPRGVQGDGHSFYPALSADGRYVAFGSWASNLVPGDTNDTFDVFVRDLQAGITRRVNVGPGGVEANLGGTDPAVSADGRFVVFSSSATNLVPGDTNGDDDVFVRDRKAGTTRRASVGPGGVQGDNHSYDPAMSWDGRFVAFTSFASNLAPGVGISGRSDVFVRDRRARTTTRVSVGPGGVLGIGGSYGPAISADGRLVAFESFAANLVPDDTNDLTDIFVHDRQTGTTRRVSVATGGGQSAGNSFYPTLSADGRLVAFTSHATNLVSGDTNGWSDVFVHTR